MNAIVIIKVGDTLPGLLQEMGDFEQWITAGMGNVQVPVTVVDPRKGMHLPDPAEPAGVIITGSHAMVSDREPWSEAVAGWLRNVVAQNIPVLGICYGHQLLAHALGGEVGYHPGGIEIGTVSVERTPEADHDALFSELPGKFAVQVVHRQSVRRLPHGAVRLAGNAFEPHQAFRVGECAWGVQFHPEFSPAAISGYIHHLANDLSISGIDAKQILGNVASASTAGQLLQKFGTYVEQRCLQPL